MQVKILGSAAGGGFPQWNCACPNCRDVRRGRFAGKPRLQTQVAFSGDSETWFLLGASPDLRLQIESSPELHPQSGTRSSPIQGVILASADLDHVLGLLLLRELQPLQVWANVGVMHILRHQNTMFGMLNRTPDQVHWKPIIPGEQFPVISLNHRDSGIHCEVVGVSSLLPAYAGRVLSDGAVLGIVLTTRSGKKLGFFPQLATLTEGLKNIFATLDCLLLDGTFWSDDELICMQGSAQSARDMGHIPVGGEDGTLQQLSALTRPRKMFVHINNTNPMLNEAGPEYKKVRDAGWELAEDGCQLTL
ncbi:MAG TPA: pyrroloquinoline quinone biosynthesis protein PqqB [Terriglobales bacterium]|nr:pyrroloquinoline quinone biosynthesis protein PqqB [Terriglobales bacterium]